MKIVIFGTGGHARVVAEAVRLRGEHEIVGLVSADGRPVPFLPGIEVVASNDNFVSRLPALGARGAIVALGSIETRKKLADLAAKHLTFVTAVHPNAVISPSARLGPGTVVMAGVVVNAGTVVGSHCILNTGATVDHDCVLEDLVHIAPGCTICGHVTIGRETMLGAGTVVSDHVAIGERSFAIAGSVVTADIPSNSRYANRVATPLRPG